MQKTAKNGDNKATNTVFNARARFVIDFNHNFEFFTSRLFLECSETLMVNFFETFSEMYFLIAKFLSNPGFEETAEVRYDGLTNEYYLQLIFTPEITSV